jgi:YtkA-like
MGDGNLMSFVVRDRAGHPVVGATVRVHADMTTMAMPVPDASAVAQGGGRYTARLLFTMAGPWRLTVVVAAPGQAVARAAFDVGVRWR